MQPGQSVVLKGPLNNRCLPYLPELEAMMRVGRELIPKPGIIVVGKISVKDEASLDLVDPDNKHLRTSLVHLFNISFLLCLSDLI